MGEIWWRPAGPQGLAPDRARGCRGALGARAFTLQVELNCLGVFALVGFRYIRVAETEHGRGPVAMSDDFQIKYVGMVALAIGAVVLLLGLVGLITNIL